jgi:putative FmdB family regulatory protein
MPVALPITAAFPAMPTYEYACPKCAHEFEHFQSMRDEPLKKCPKCKKPGVKRLVGGGAGLIFKGTGFYITDYKKKSGGESKSGGEPKAGGETKTTAAPAKTETKTPAAPSPKASSHSAKPKSSHD